MHDTVFSKEIIRMVNGKRRNLPRTSRVTGVSVLLSPLSHVTVKSLTEAFSQMVHGTDLEQVSIVVKPLSVSMRCADCGERFGVTQPSFSCVRCGSLSIHVDDNREFLVESMEIEEG